MSTRLEYSITAKCRPEHIWKKFESLDQWAWWNKVIARARWTEGQPWQKGSQFELEFIRPKTLKLKSEVIESATPNRIGWRHSGGLSGEQHFSFELQSDGDTTVLKTWQDLTGLRTLLFGNGARQEFVKMYEAWLEALKFEAERIAREERARS